jgi:spoIIIJ-associated protein
VGDWIKVLLDVNNYREEQKERLMSMARQLANKVLETGRAVSMTAMSSYERRLCHMAISEIEGVHSQSEGEGENRHLIIKPGKDETIDQGGDSNAIKE